MKQTAKYRSLLPSRQIISSLYLNHFALIDVFFIQVKKAPDPSADLFYTEIFAR